MNCDKCGSPLLDGELFCKECGYEYAYQKQREKLHKAEEKQRSLIKDHCHTKLFLILSICLTVTAITNLSSAFIGGVFTIFTSLLPTIFMIVTVIGLWISYFAKTDEALEKGLKKVYAYDSYQKVMIDIIIVIAIIIFSIVTFTIIGSCTTLNSMTDSSDATGPSFITWIIALVIVGAIAGILTPFKNIYISRIDFVKAMKQSVSSGKHYPLYFSKRGSYAIGIIIMIPAVLGIILSSLMSQALSGLDSIIGDLTGSTEMGDFTDLSGILGSVLGGISDSANTIVASTIVSNVSELCFGLYFILSANWMGSMQEAYIHANKICEQERASLAEVDRDTRRAIGIFRNEEKMKNEQEAKASVTQPISAPKKEVVDEKSAYSIVKDGKGSAPITVDKLREMAINGELLPETMVWKRGMSSWVRADSVDELADSFPPPIDMPDLPPVDMPPVPVAEETINITADTDDINDSTNIQSNSKE